MRPERWPPLPARAAARLRRWLLAASLAALAALGWASYGSSPAAGLQRSLDALWSLCAAR